MVRMASLVDGIAIVMAAQGDSSLGHFIYLFIYFLIYFFGLAAQHVGS